MLRDAGRGPCPQLQDSDVCEVVEVDGNREKKTVKTEISEALPKYIDFIAEDG